MIRRLIILLLIVGCDLLQEEDCAGVARGTNEGSKLAGNAMLWDTGNLIFNSYFATSGFNALPAATLWFDGEDFYDGGLYTRAYFWSSTENIYRAIWHNRSDIKRRVDVEESMLSIRCLKD